MPTKEILITKANGEKEPFDVEKLEESLLRAHASKNNIQQIISTIVNELEDGMSTHEIYKHAFSQLQQLEKKASIHYSLRRAVFELGPSGFPFEKLVAAILREKGYETKTDQMVKGHCVEHEVDVVAWKDDQLIMCEAKYHSQVGMNSDLKVVLYVKARFDDLQKATYTYGAEPQPMTEGWLITNTKFSSSAIKYAECQGIKVIGWNYPMDGSLSDLMEESKVYPLTCLHTLSDHDKKMLLEKGVVVCDELIKDESLLTTIGLTQANIDAVREEISLLEQNI
jgi:hypothetical protein